LDENDEWIYLFNFAEVVATALNENARTDPPTTIAAVDSYPSYIL